jgi:hypothetical protein
MLNIAVGLAAAGLLSFEKGGSVMLVLRGILRNSRTGDGIVAHVFLFFLISVELPDKDKQI